jgi:hypothetical protein
MIKYLLEAVLHSMDGVIADQVYELPVVSEEGSLNGFDDLSSAVVRAAGRRRVNAGSIPLERTDLRHVVGVF